MGIATGEIPQGSAAAGSSVLNSAKGEMRCHAGCTQPAYIYICTRCRCPSFFLSLPVVASLHAVVSDAGRGGQVLMCGRTFLAVKDLGRELGCVTQDGPKLVKPEHPFWFR